jgi:hypothetical protein
MHPFFVFLILSCFLILTVLFLFCQQVSFGRKRAEHVGYVRLQGHSKFLQKRGQERAKQGKIIAARGSVRFAGRRLVRQRSLPADLTFWLLLCQDKSNSPPAAIERADVS